MPSVDVVVPCYNYGRFLERCVGSVLSQSGVDVRVLIVDDHSFDSTAEIAAALANRDLRVKCQRHELNHGHIATYNEGLLGWASAEYSVLLSADDLLAPGALARATSLMERHPDIGMAYGMALTFSDEAEIPAPPELSFHDTRIIPGWQLIKHFCEVGNEVASPSVVVRTAVQKKLGGYRAHLPHSGDMEMWMRFAAAGPVGVLRSVQALYRRHSENMTLQYNRTLIGDRLEKLAACTEALNAWGKDFPGFSDWVSAMADRLGEEVFWLASDAFDAGELESSREYLAVAIRLNRRLRGSPSWWRFQLKSLLGRRLSGMYQDIRSSQQRGGIGDRCAEHNEHSSARVFGWWPIGEP